jgi:hypothetical protein
MGKLGWVLVAAGMVQGMTACSEASGDGAPATAASEAAGASSTPVGSEGGAEAPSGAAGETSAGGAGGASKPTASGGTAATGGDGVEGGAESGSAATGGAIAIGAGGAGVEPAGGQAPAAGAGAGAGGVVGEAGATGEAGAAGVAGAGGARPVGTAEAIFGMALPSQGMGWGELLLGTTPEGDVVVAGEANEAADLGVAGGTPDDPVTFVLVLSPSGERLAQWIYPDAIRPEQLAVRADGKAVLTGQLYQTVTLGGRTLEPVEEGYYLAVLDLATGKADVLVPVPTTDTAWPGTVVTDGDGSIYVAGGVTRFDPTWTESAFLTKFSPDGALLYHQEFENCDSTGRIQDLAIDDDGTLVAVGAFNCTIYFGDEYLVTRAFSSGFPSYNGFVAWLDPSTGAPERAMRFGGETFDYAQTIDRVSAGTFRVTGTVSGASEIGGLPLAADLEGSAFVAELDSTGTARWAEVLDGDSILFNATTSSGLTHAVGRNDDLVAADDYQLGASESLVASFGPDGVLARQIRFTTNANGALHVTVDGAGGLWVSGEFVGELRLPSDTLRLDQPGQYLLRFPAAD